jgi:hypothetical protein
VPAKREVVGVLVQYATGEGFDIDTIAVRSDLSLHELEDDREPGIFDVKSLVQVKH